MGLSSVLGFPDIQPVALRLGQETSRLVTRAPVESQDRICFMRIIKRKKGTNSGYEDVK